MRNNILLILFFLSAPAADAQKLKKEDKQVIANLQKHVSILASDSLEGRRTGTAGEQKAMYYISAEFRAAGLQPKGSNEFYQSFEINEGKQINAGTHLLVGGHALTLNKDFFPLPYSSNSSIEALPSMAIQELNMPWFFNLKELFEQHKQNPHFNLSESIRNIAKESAKKGATALFIYNTSEIQDNLAFSGRDASEQVSIPVVYLTSEAVKKYFHDAEATLDLKLKTDIGAKKRTGTNVVGYIDNKAPHTVIVGAHFDHVGYGEDGNSLDKAKQVHNGADDNASGVAAVIELAKMLKSGPRQNNYLFVAFSGEELGLYGSKHFVQHPTIDLRTVNYMINLDMIGRLNASDPVLTVGGFGTSPFWATAYQQTGKKALFNTSLKFRFDSSGVGPSDHSSFYFKDIPVLFYFTGLHGDYHRTSDDYDKLNYTGHFYIVRHIYSLIDAQARTAAKLEFQKTRETQMNTAATFSVTLGIMPDYTFSGTGVRIDGVVDSRPAEKAGMKSGDVIIRLGDFAVASMEDYMQALGKFKKGDKTTVHYNRGHQRLSSPVEF
jgi:Zn-dependent M28 family amino/carboxypeptidase